MMARLTSSCLTNAIESAPQLLRRSRAEVIEDRSFAEAVYRAAIADVRIGRGRHAPNSRIVGRRTIPQEQIGDGANSGVDALGPLRRAIGDEIQNRSEVGKGRKRITLPHRPCLAQTARTCSSVANSPRSAAALGRAMASRSSCEREMGADISEPASCMIARAMSS